MLTIHTDVPHPVPPIAYLRYKENWAFCFFDIANDVYGVAHFSYEPVLDRARASCNLMVCGELFKYGHQESFPPDFGAAPEIGSGALHVRFVSEHARIEMRMDSADAVLDICFDKLAPLFSFDACDAAFPDRPSFSEILSIGANRDNHTETQAMSFSGPLAMKSGKSAGRTMALSGLSYRDHSRCIRSDNFLARHVWSFLHFPDRIFGVTSLTNRLRPTLTWTGGYVHDADGTRVLHGIDIVESGRMPEGIPARVEFKLVDAGGASYTVVGDVAGRFGQVPLIPEVPKAGSVVYSVVENFCPVLLQESGEAGSALIELGRSVQY